MSDACDGDATMCGEDAKARRVSRGNTFEQRNNVRRLRGDREKIEKRLRGHRNADRRHVYPPSTKRRPVTPSGDSACSG